MLCPCSRCRRMAYHKKEEDEHHLVTKGFDKNFIKKQQECHDRAAEPIGVDDDDEGEGGADQDDREATTNLFSSLISGAIHG